MCVWYWEQNQSLTSTSKCSTNKLEPLCLLYFLLLRQGLSRLQSLNQLPYSQSRPQSCDPSASVFQVAGITGLTSVNYYKLQNPKFLSSIEFSLNLILILSHPSTIPIENTMDTQTSSYSCYSLFWWMIALNQISQTKPEFYPWCDSSSSPQIQLLSQFYFLNLQSINFIQSICSSPTHQIQIIHHFPYQL